MTDQEKALWIAVFAAVYAKEIPYPCDMSDSIYLNHAYNQARRAANYAVERQIEQREYEEYKK